MIDLHLHTNHSDGTDTVTELLEKAEQLKLEIISITDHDTVEAYKELENSEIRNKFSGEILPGVEIKAIYDNHNIEVLGYGINPNNIKIYKCDNLQEKILEHFKQVADRYEIKYDKYMSGGSDYHAKNKSDIQIGTGRNNLHIDKEFVENWIKVLPKI